MLTGSGMCMHPTIRTGDVVRVRPAGELRPGDIAVYRRGGSFICHRVLRVSEGQIITRSDRNRGHADAPVAPEDLLGVVVQVTRNGRPVSLGQRAAPGSEALTTRLAIARGQGRGLLLRLAERVQRLPGYTAAGRVILRVPARTRMSLRVPLRATDSVFQELPLKPAGLGSGKVPAGLRPGTQRVIVVAHLTNSGTPAAQLPLQLADGCWSPEEPAVRNRYRRLGLESDLRAAAELLPPPPQ